MTVLFLVLDIVRYLCYLFGLLLVMRSVLSWFPLKPTNVLKIYLFRVTEPLLAPVRRIVPRTGVVDLSPLVAIFLLVLLFSLSSSIQRLLY